MSCALEERKMGQTFTRLTLLVAGIVIFTTDAFAQKQPIGQRDEDHWRVIRAIEWEVDSLHANHVMIPLGQDGTKTTKVFFGTVKCHLEYLGPNLKLKGKEAQSTLWVFCMPLADGSRPSAGEAYKHRLKSVFLTGPTFHHLPHPKRGKETTRE